MKNKLVIELRGVEFINKGAELMLQSILAAVREANADAVFVMELNPRSPRRKHRANGIYTKTNIPLVKIKLHRLLDLLPDSVLNRLGLVPERQIGVVLDGSGFAFGDQWGPRKAGTRLADHIVRWKAQGKKVILLPQAFGPFKNESLAEKMRVILKEADLVFARDRISYNYLCALYSGEKVKLRPDFTNLSKGIIPDRFKRSRDEVALIPNYKMIEVTDAGAGAAYLDFLQKVAMRIREKEFKPFFLIHEARMDARIAEEVNARLPAPIPVIREDDPLKVKGIIGASRAVITSRFHGLVSCLSQAVPCLATGWSHKYEMLLEDYGYREGLVEVDYTDEELAARLDMILDEASHRAIREELALKSREQKELSRSMWKEVFGLLHISEKQPDTVPL